ncbi:hypothetical protein N658DRAFT_91695 [Parathielavia hyrcaniae]|uniref:Uncharacterized protein n=1 Tax=Parathielavia hyrcaniae TaxID=113614 RepID=A0AAN6Q448_9PEZI|nr:hypothetical protein N658DRAFT_91695 [Parathielavia hyrcaniae]
MRGLQVNTMMPLSGAHLVSIACNESSARTDSASDQEHKRPGCTVGAFVLWTNVWLVLVTPE